jgi:hypothetical protein
VPGAAIGTLPGFFPFTSEKKHISTNLLFTVFRNKYTDTNACDSALNSPGEYD